MQYKYSKISASSQIFLFINRLEKANWQGGTIFSDFKDLKDRLFKLTGSFNAGNSSIQLRNEAIEILDHLLKKNKISKEQYNAFIQKYFT